MATRLFDQASHAESHDPRRVCIVCSHYTSSRIGLVVGLNGGSMRAHDNPEFSFPPFSQCQPLRDSPLAGRQPLLLSKLVSLLAIDCEKGEVSTCVSPYEGLPADRV